MPFYRKHGKILTPITPKDFNTIMTTGHFCHLKHKGFIVLLYYSGVRVSEAIRSLKEQFIFTPKEIVFNVGARLKKKTTFETPPLNFPLDAPHINSLKYAIENTKSGKRVFPFCRQTAWNICDRVGYYNHFFRLNRVTNFLLDEYSIVQVRSWTGLSLRALEFYVGLVDVMKMGEKIK